MTIVTTRPRKRPAKPAQAAAIKVPRIVQHTPKGRAWKLPPDDPEAKARAVAFFSRMGIKRADHDQGGREGGDRDGSGGLCHGLPFDLATGGITVLTGQNVKGNNGGDGGR